MMNIRESTEADMDAILHIHKTAFGDDEGPVIADLVNELFNDQTAKPMLSLLAVDQNKPIAHILFTKTVVTQTAENVSAQILAPLAVLPESQSNGVGGQLIKEGLQLLKDAGVDLVFVLGYPDYYSRHGFKPAGERGYEAPYEILEKNAGAWMVQELQPGVIARVSGIVQCCDVLDQPELWQE